MVMRMLAEMAVANPSTGSFADYARNALGNWAGFSVGWLYWYFWVIVVGFEADRRRQDHPVLDRRPAVVVRVGPHGPDDGDQPVLGLVVRRVRVLVRRHQGGRDHRVHRARRAVRVRAVAEQVLDFSNLTGARRILPERRPCAITVGVVTVIFSMVGAEIATIAAAESADPERAVAKAANSVILRIAIFFVGSVVPAR